MFLGLLLLGSSSPAFAESAEEIASARSLARQGIGAFEAGDAEEARNLLARAESLYHAPTHLLYLARAQERLGLLVESTETYRRLVREKLGKDAPEAYQEAQKNGKVELALIEPRLAEVKIQIQGQSADDVQVLVDERPVPTATLGVTRPINPGTYEFSVLSDEVGASPVTATIEEGASATVSLVLYSKGAAREGARASSVAFSPAESTSAGTARSLGYVSLGMGVVGLGVGTGFLIPYLSRNEQARSAFDEKNCEADLQCSPADQNEIVDDAKDAALYGTIAIVGYAVGAVGIVAGLTLLATNKKTVQERKVARENRRHVSPLLGLGTVGVTGRF